MKAKIAFDVYELDMWADGEGGWTENNRIKVGQISVPVKTLDDITPKALLLAMKGESADNTHPYITTTDQRRVYAEDLYGMGEWWEVGAVKNHYPMFGLQLVENAA